MPALPSLSQYFDQLNANHTAMMSKLDEVIGAVQAVGTAVQGVETATQSIRGDKTLEDIYNLLVSLQGGTTFSDLATGEVIDCTLRGLIEKIHKLQGLPLDPRSGEAQYTQVTFRTLYDILGGADPGTAEPLGIWDSVTEAMGFIDDGLGIFDNIRGLAQLGVASANVGTTAATAAGTYITAAALAMMSYQIADLHNTLKNNNVATDGIFTGMNALTSETTTAGRVGLVDVRSDLAAQLGSLAGISGQVTAEGTKLTAIESYTADFVTQLELLMSGEQHQTGTNLADLLVKLHCICQGVSELVLNAPAGDVNMLEPPAGGTGGSVDCQRASWITGYMYWVVTASYTELCNKESVHEVVGRLIGVRISDGAADEWAKILNKIILSDLIDTLWADYDEMMIAAIRCAIVNASGAGAARAAIASIADGAASGEPLIRWMIVAMFPLEVLNALYSGRIPLDTRVLESHSSDCSDCGDPPCCAGVDLGPVALTSQSSTDSTYQLSKFPSEWPCVTSATDPMYGTSAARCFVADGCELTIVLTDITTAELNITQPYTEPTPGTLVFTSVGAGVGFSNSNPTPFNYTARLREI
jgi:hypothetical protein